MVKITTKQLTISSFFVALMCLSSIISLKFLLLTSIPFSLQIYMVLVIGSLLEKRLAVLVVLCYILLGIVGLPVFSSMNSGIGTVLGSTGGFILGFIPTVYVVGSLTKNIDKYFKNKDFGIFIVLFLGLLITYTCGTLQFMFVVKVSLTKAILTTVAPFILFDIIKIFLVIKSIKYLGAAK